MLNDQLSDTLAERYAEFADILAEVDLAALDAKIARLQRLRALVGALQAGQPHQPQKPTLPQSDEDDGDTPDRRPRGFWPEFVHSVLCSANRPLTVAEIASHLTTPQKNAASIISSAARADGRFERVPDSDPTRWRLAAAEPRLAELA